MVLVVGDYVRVSNLGFVEWGLTQRAKIDINRRR